VTLWQRGCRRTAVERVRRDRRHVSGSARTADAPRAWRGPSHAFFCCAGALDTARARGTAMTVLLLAGLAYTLMHRLRARPARHRTDERLRGDDPRAAAQDRGGDAAQHPAHPPDVRLAPSTARVVRRGCQPSRHCRPVGPKKCCPRHAINNGGRGWCRLRGGKQTSTDPAPLKIPRNEHPEPHQPRIRGAGEISGPGACRTWVIESETAGERGPILMTSTNVSGIREEKAAEYGPLSHRCSRIIPSQTGSHAASRMLHWTRVNPTHLPTHSIA
jgi:hypothetical protein